MKEYKARKYPQKRCDSPIAAIIIIAALLLVYIFVLVTAPHNDAEVLSVIIRQEQTTETAVILYNDGTYETMHIKHTDDAYHVEKMCVVTTLYNYGDKSITVEKSKIVYLAGIQPQG